MRQNIKRLTYNKRRTPALFFAAFLVFTLFLLDLVTLSATELITDNTITSTYATTVQKGDTLFGIIGKTGASKNSAAQAVRAFTKIGNPAKLQVGREVLILLHKNAANPPELFAFSIRINKNRYIEVSRSTDKTYVARISSHLKLFKASNAEISAQKTFVSIRVKRGQTLGGIMSDFNIQQKDIHHSIKALKKLYNPKHLKWGQLVTIWPEYGTSKPRLPLLGLSIHFKNNVVEVRRRDSGNFSAQRLPASTLGKKEENRTLRTNTVANSPANLKTISVRKGDTLMKLLTFHGVPRTEAESAIKSLRKYFKPKKLRAGHNLYILLRPKEQTILLAGFSIPISKKKFVTVSRLEKGTFTAGHTISPIKLKIGVVKQANLKSKNGTNFETTRTKIPVSKKKNIVSSVNKIDNKNASRANTTDTKINLVNIYVDRGDTLMAILRSEGIDRYEADAAISSLRRIFNPRRLREKQRLIVANITDNLGRKSLVGFNVRISEGNHIEVQKIGKNNFSVSKVSESKFIERTYSLGFSKDKSEDLVQNSPVKLLPISKQGQVMDGAVFAAASPEDVNFEYTNNIFRKDINKEPMNGLLNRFVEIEKGNTLFVALKKAGSNPSDAEAAITAFRTLHNPRNLQIGQKLSVTLDSKTTDQETTGLKLEKFVLNVAPDRDIQVTRKTDKTFVATPISRDLIRTLETSHGIIQTSLYDAASEAGLPINTLMEMVQIFSFDVDFQRDIQKGDQFEVLYENLMNKQGETVALSPLLFAQLTLSGQNISLYRYKPRDGLVDYFDEKGQSARKALMRTPISGARLSSGYGMRKHPILGYNKMHRGLDFAAPSGTPIFAAGDGKIETAGRNGAYGNYIRIRHNSTYKTAYAHLKGFARGIRAGKRVRQGQTIGYVGSTGRSTGPHLHYEIIANGHQINPRKLKLPTGQKLKGKDLDLFLDQKRKIYILKSEAKRPIITH